MGFAKPQKITSAGGAVTYFKENGKDLDSYLAEEVKGEWYGKGVETLGLKQGDAVEKEAFENVLNGKSVDGKDLYTKTANGKLQVFEHKPGTDGKQRLGYDIELDFDKSLSILAVEHGEEWLKDVQREAYIHAMEYAVEKGFITYRVQEGGVREAVPTDQIIIALHQHTLSRRNDAQLHMHGAFVNMTFDKEGYARALDYDGLFQNRYLLSQVANNYVAAKAREHSLATEQGEHAPRVIGSNPAVEQIKSKRREETLQRFEENQAKGYMTNASMTDQMRAAAIGTRPAKSKMAPEELKARQDAEYLQAGTTKEAMREEIRQAGIKQRDHLEHNAPMNAQECVLQAAQDKTLNDAVFSRNRLIIDALKLGSGVHQVKDVEKAIDELVKGDKLYELNGEAKDGSVKMTTPEMYDLERRIVDEVRQSAGTVAPITTLEKAEKLAADYQAKNFNFEKTQLGAALHLLTNEDRFTGIQGDAGTGKTTVLKFVNQVYEAEGCTVLGLTPSAIAATNMQEKSGIKSQTIDSFLIQFEKDGAGLTGDHSQAGNVRFIVDEASMLDARKMEKLMQVAEATGGQFVLIGDEKQLPAVGAGQVFKTLQDQKACEFKVMNEIRRQRAGSAELAAVQAISARKHEDAFEILEKNGMIVEIKDEAERFKAMAQDYVAHGLETGMNLDRNADRKALNEVIREMRIEAGEIERGHLLTVRENAGIRPEAAHRAQSYNVGDILIAQEAFDGVKKGGEGRVSGIDREANTLTVDWKVKAVGYGESAKGKGGDTRKFYYDDVQTKTVDLQRDGSKLSAWQERNIHLAAGDKIIYGKNDTGLGIDNTGRAIITKIDAKGNAQVLEGAEVKRDAKGNAIKDGKGNEVWEGGKTKTFNVLKQYPYVSHGYAATTHGMQGLTTPRQLPQADGRSSFESIYVGLSRTEGEMKVYTSDKEAMKEASGREQVRESTLSFERLVQRAEKTEEAKDKRAGTPQTEQAQEERRERAYGKALKSQVKTMLDSAKTFYYKYADPKKYEELKGFAKETVDQAKAGVVVENPYTKAGDQAQQHQQEHTKAPAIQGPAPSRELTIGNLDRLPHVTPEILGGLHKDGYEKLTLELRDGTKLTLDVQREYATEVSMQKALDGKIEGGLAVVKDARKEAEALKTEVQKTAEPTNHTEAAKRFESPADAAKAEKDGKPELTANGQKVERTPEQRNEQAQEHTQAGTRETPTREGQSIEEKTGTKDASNSARERATESSTRATTQTTQDNQQSQTRSSDSSSRSHESSKSNDRGDYEKER